MPLAREYDCALFHFWHRELSEEQITLVEELAKAGKNRAIPRSLHGLRGEWRLERGEWARPLTVSVRP